MERPLQSKIDHTFSSTAPWTLTFWLWPARKCEMWNILPTRIRFFAAFAVWKTLMDHTGKILSMFLRNLAGELVGIYLISSAPKFSKLKINSTKIEGYSQRSLGFLIFQAPCKRKVKTHTEPEKNLLVDKLWLRGAIPWKFSQYIVVDFNKFGLVSRTNTLQASPSCERSLQISFH